MWKIFFIFVIEILQLKMLENNILLNVHEKLYIESQEKSNTNIIFKNKYLRLIYTWLVCIRKQNFIH